jgi:pimeloyl-ACP methyl ester carboxylesterase
VRVAGISGGGPYALVCAALLGARVLRTAVVSGVGPPGAAPASDFTPLMRLAFALAPRVPPSIRPFAAVAGALARRLPERYFEVLGVGLNASDRRVFARPDVRAMFREDMVEAFAQSSRALADDLTLITSPWEVDLSAIANPLALWYGGEDRVIPVATGRAIAARVASAELRELSGEGHFFVFERWREILSLLMR